MGGKVEAGGWARREVNKLARVEPQEASTRMQVCREIGRAHPLATGIDGWVRTRRGATSQPTGREGFAFRYVSLSCSEMAFNTACLTAAASFVCLASLMSTAVADLLLLAAAASVKGLKAASEPPRVGCGPFGDREVAMTSCQQPTRANQARAVLTGSFAGTLRTNLFRRSDAAKRRRSIMSICVKSIADHADATAARARRRPAQRSARQRPQHAQLIPQCMQEAVQAVTGTAPAPKRGMASSFFTNLLSDSDDNGASSYTDTSTQPSLLDRARTAAGLQPTRREEIIDNYCLQLTWKQRLYGFFICFGIGFLVSLGSFMFWTDLLAGRPTKFAINFTIGNAIEVLSTGFLMGFARQLKRMSHPTRWGTALIFVLAMAATLFSAIFLERLTKWPTSMVAMIIVICIVVQTLAMFWYALSYIPYGRRMFKACCVSVMSDGE